MYKRTSVYYSLEALVLLLFNYREVFIFIFVKYPYLEP
jgi:hypothetical protein